MDESLRVCRDCGLVALTEKDLELFLKRKNYPYGRDNWCRKCRAVYMRNTRRRNFEGLIKCEICDTKLHRITGIHLKGFTCQSTQKGKNINVFNSKQYKKMFPHALLMSEHEFNILSNAGKRGGYITGQRLTTEQKKERSRKAGRAYVASRTQEELTEWGRKNAKKGGVLGGKACWKNMSPEEFERRRVEWNKRFRSYWDNLTPKEKSAHGRRGGLAALKKLQSPNKQELWLAEILKPLGFTFNKNVFRVISHSNILNRERAMVPDFTHSSLPILIEFDGNAGHDPSKPWVPMNQPQLDDERDILYRENGYKIIRFIPEDLELGEIHIIDTVKEVLAFFQGTTLTQRTMRVYARSHISASRSRLRDNISSHFLCLS